MKQCTALKLVNKMLLYRWFKGWCIPWATYKYFYFLKIDTNIIEGVSYVNYSRGVIFEPFTNNTIFIWEKLNELKVVTKNDNSNIKEAKKKLTKYLLKN